MPFTPNPVDLDRNAHNFVFHPPSDQTQTERYVEIRLRLKGIADYFLTACPPSRELSTALTKLEEAMFWANASIARGGPQPFA